tara:strand:+ start:113 stop:418 length:306 start_codon:yes stop_codon:yes gene_type:complete
MKNKTITPAKANMMAMAKNGGLAGFKNGGGAYDGLMKAQPGIELQPKMITLDPATIPQQNGNDAFTRSIVRDIVHTKPGTRRNNADEMNQMRRNYSKRILK